MTAFADMQKPSAILRRHDYEHPAGTPRWNLWFICPGCRMGHAFDERWSFDGDYERPTFSPSLLVDGQDCSRRCHSFVRAGAIEFLNDCHHDLAGKTVPIPDWRDDKVFGDD